MNKNFDINYYINEFTEVFLPSNWEWRKGQKEIIIEVIETYINKTHKVVIMDLPTGSGKSIIAMCISYILNKLNKTGYILASDLSLQDQYEKDFHKFNLQYGSVRGVDNYICIDNGEKHSIGTCKIRGRAPKSMKCYDECPYFCARQEAAESPTSLLNYSYWLIMMNYVYSRNIENEEAEVLFEPRDFVISDECHKVLDIVQNHFSPKFDKNTLIKLKRITDFYETYKVKDHHIQYKNIEKNIKKLYKEEDQKALLNILEEIEINLERYLPSNEILKTKIRENNPGKKVAKEWRDAARLADWVKDLHCKIEDYVEIIQNTSVKSLIKNPQGESLTFNCLEEYYLMNNYFNKWCEFTIFMSATISDVSQYLKSISVSNAKYIKMDSLFDFAKSPIKYYPGYKMNYKSINDNLPWLYENINRICEDHKNENGIIHTASYDLALKIFTNVDKNTQKRLLVYSGTEEKRDVIEILKRDNNKILIGPSLTTGLDLKDSWSRFSIIAKMPYPSLSDRYIQAKMNKEPGWYQWKTILDIMQAIGRGVRHETDWCVTYILDGCFGDILHYNRKSFPAEFIQRILTIS